MRMVCISSEWERNGLFIQFELVAAIERLAYFKEMLLSGSGLALMTNTKEY